jgi:hypothetical protein
MPWKEIHVPAAVLIDLGDRIVYYTYNDGDANEPELYWYTFEADSDDTFDVRDLPQYDEQKGRLLNSNFSIEEYDEKMRVIRSYHAEVIQKAYKSGDLLKEDDGNA